MSSHRDNVDDDIYQTFESAAEALGRRIRSDSKQPRGPRTSFSSARRSQHPDVRAEQPEIMRAAQLEQTWSDEHQLSRPPELPDDFDNADEAESESSADSEYDGPSTISRTLVSGHLGSIRMHQAGQSVASYGKGAVPQPGLDKATAASLVSTSADNAHPTSPKVVHRRAESQKFVTPLSSTIPHPEQQARPQTPLVNPPQDGRGTPSDTSRNSLRSRRNRQTRYRNSMVVCFLLVIVLIPAQIYSAGESTHIRFTRPPTDPGCTTDNDTFDILLEFLLGVLHNVAPLALLIASIVRERGRAMYGGYLLWFAAMLTVFVGIMITSIALQVGGKREYATLLIGISDSWFVATTFFYFEYVLRPLDIPEEEPGRGL
jgi:hypothetical protein